MLPDQLLYEVLENAILNSEGLSGADWLKMIIHQIIKQMSEKTHYNFYRIDSEVKLGL
jgi:hypothetical protein